MNDHTTPEEREAWAEIAPRAQWVDADGAVIDESPEATNDIARETARRWCASASAEPGDVFRAVGMHGSPVWTYRRNPDGTVTEDV